jgi:HAMP domain-containing protein
VSNGGKALFVFDHAFLPDDPAYPEAGLPLQSNELVELWAKLKPQRFEAAKSIGQFAAAYQAKDPQATKSKLTQTVNADGQPLLLVSYPIPQAGTATVIGYNLAPLQAQLNSSLWTALAVLLITVLITMVLVSGFANRLIQSVVGLASSADQISLGEMNEPLTNYPKDELGILAQAIERLRISVEMLMKRQAKRS